MTCGRACGVPSSRRTPIRSRPSRCPTTSGNRFCRLDRFRRTRASCCCISGSTIAGGYCSGAAARSASRATQATGSISKPCCRDLFPQVKGARIDYRWCGRVSITRDFLPHLHEPAPGLADRHRLHGARHCACRPRSVRRWRNICDHGKCRRLPLPLQPIRPLPFHALNKAYFAAAVAWYRFLDRRGAGDLI